MRIGISTRGLNQGSFAISSIIFHLTQTIIELTPKNHEIFLYLNNLDFEPLFSPSTYKRSININNRLIWDHAWLPYALRKDRVDIALFMKGTMPLLLPCQGAVIFHDLGYFDNILRPYRYLETIYMKKMMALAAHRAIKIFAISEYTKSEIVTHLNVDPGKIIVNYINCTPIYKPIEDGELLTSIKALYHLPAKYIFSPISLTPRKNVDRILDAFEEIKDRIPHNLVITGGQSWQERNLVKRKIIENNQRVQVLGEVPEDHMPALYNLAHFTIYPSLMEGFGLPILEAFRCGCPVLTSNITSMPEVAIDAAYLVDPYDTNQIAEGMIKLAQDEKIRGDLRERGFDRAKTFSWERTANVILQELGVF